MRNINSIDRAILFVLGVSAVLGACGNEPSQPVEEQENLVTRDAFVIGFDQCARYKGRILAIVNPRDTVITYNFPDSVYTFPDSYYSNYLFDCLFPDSVVSKYPVKVTYRPAKSEELSAYICLSNIYIKRLAPLVRNKQVVIVTLTVK